MADTKNVGFVPKRDYQVTPQIEAARAAVAKYGEMKLSATLYKPIRRSAGGNFFLYEVKFNTQDEYEAYKEVMSQVKIEGSKNGTAFIDDAVTEKTLFTLPVAAGKNITLSWTTGDPNVNPLGRFIVDDAEAQMASSQRISAHIETERGKFLAQRSFGLRGAINEPFANRTQSSKGGAETLSAEEIAKAMEAAKQDVD